MPSPRGSGFIGLGQYLQANQQAAQQMGNALAQGIEQEGSATKQATDDAVRTFNDEAGVNQQYAPVVGGPSRSAAMNGGVTMMNNTIAANRVLKGPNELGDVTDIDALNARASAAGDRARFGASDAGVGVLLSQQGGANTQGGRVLDSFLARRGAGERLDKAASAYGRLGAYVGAQQEQAKQASAAAKERAQKVVGLNPYTGWPTQAVTTPQSAAPAAPSAAATNPRVKNAEQIAEENRRKAKIGARG